MFVSYLHFFVTYYIYNMSNILINNHKCTLSKVKGGFNYLPSLSYYMSFESWIRSATTISPSNPLTRYDFRSIKSIEDERKRHTNSKFWYTIHPYSMFNYYWMSIMMIIFMVAQPCDCISSVFYFHDVGEAKSLSCILMIVNTFNVAHIFVTFLTGYQALTQESEISLKGLDKVEVSTITFDPRKIAKRYLKSYFLIDIQSAINLFFVVHEYVDGKTEILQALPYIFRIFRMLTVIKSFRTLFMNFAESDVIIRIFKYILWIWVILMYFGSYQLIIPHLIDFWSNKHRATFMVQIKNIYGFYGRQEPQLDLCLVHSIFEVAQEIAAPIRRVPKVVIEERILFVLICFIGLIGKLYIFAGIYSLLDQGHRLDQKYHLFLQEMKSFLQSLDVVKPLYGETIAYVQDLMQGKYFSERDVLRVLPDTNKQSIFFDYSLHFITHCNLFMDAEYEQMVSLTLKLKYELLFPGKTIIELGDKLTCVYFIFSGTVAIYAKNGLELYHRSDGYYFGENGLLPGDNYSEIQVIAIERCTLYVLKRSDFEKIVKNDKKVYDFIRRTINRKQTRQTRRITAASTGKSERRTKFF